MKKSRVLTISVVIILGLISSNSCIGQIFVNLNATGNNNGTSWINAFNNLQIALDGASNKNQIWIATGTYYPGQSGDSKNTTFHISKGVELLGGFIGTEVNATERNITENPTILSGDLNRDDIIDNFESNRNDNVWTVMLVENRSANISVFDGLTFRSGHSNGNNELHEASNGGGLLLYGPALVRNCSFTQNYSNKRAGALYMVDSLGIENQGLEIDNCRFQKKFFTFWWSS